MPKVTSDQSELLIKAEDNGQFFIIECTIVHSTNRRALGSRYRIPRGENVSLYEVIDQLSSMCL